MKKITFFSGLIQWLLKTGVHNHVLPGKQIKKEGLPLVINITPKINDRKV